MFSIGGFIFCMYVLLRVTNGLNYYNISSSSNCPTYNPGSIIFASSLKRPKRGDFVCVRKLGVKNIRIYRCIAIGGDQLEIKSSIVYLNGKRLQENYTWNEYYIPQKTLDSIDGYVKEHNYPVYSLKDSISVITMAANDLKKYHLNLKPLVYPAGVLDSNLFVDFRNKKYNVDNLGPLKIPAKNYFLLGDNRHNSFDCRYTGFVKEDEVIATVIR